MTRHINPCIYLITQLLIQTPLVKIQAIPTRRKHVIRLQDARDRNAPVEDALYVWIMKMESRRATLTDCVLETKAKAIGAELGLISFKCSHVWSLKFKKRLGMTQQVRVPKASR